MTEKAASKITTQQALSELFASNCFQNTERRKNEVECWYLSPKLP